MENILDALAIYGYSNLEDRIEFELDGVIEKEIAPAYCNENFELCVSCMDYTSLKVTDTEKSIMTFVSELLKKLKKNTLPDVASVCVFPRFTSLVKENLVGTQIKTTVVGACFPAAQTFLDVKLAECMAAIAVNATPETVYVICEALRQFHAQTGKMVGIKVAGGITKIQNAIRYLTIVKHILGEQWLTPAYFRIGTSQLLEDVLKEMKTVKING